MVGGMRHSQESQSCPEAKEGTNEAQVGPTNCRLILLRRQSSHRLYYFRRTKILWIEEVLVGIFMPSPGGGILGGAGSAAL